MSSTSAIRRTGRLTSSENSLNQHIKLKHPEAWEKIKGQMAEVDEGEGQGEENGENQEVEIEEKS